MEEIKSLPADQDTAKVLSPCISVCQMDFLDGFCIGCYRTSGEIASWPSMDVSDQLKLLNILSERRVAASDVKRRRPRRQAQQFGL